MKKRPITGMADSRCGDHYICHVRVHAHR
jgi:hypothetical protein